MQRLSLLLLCLLFFSCLVISQGTTNQVYFAPPVNTAYSKLGAIRGCAGIIGDNYYIIENDYGGRFDFNNNIQTIITTFSIKKGNLIRRFNLNELVANSRKEINKILFCDVIVWKDKIIGFYTFKGVSSKGRLCSAVICDASGKVLKDGIDIGEIEQDHQQGAFLWQRGILINGRNKLSISDDFEYRFSPDSLSLLTRTSPPANGAGNTKFIVFNSMLEKQREVVVNIPVREKIADMTDFAIDNNGFIYVTTKSYKSKSERKKVSDDDNADWDLHIISKTDMKVKTSTLNIPGRTLNFSALVIKNDNLVYCTGTYWDTDNKKAKSKTQGIYLVHVNNKENAWSFTRRNYNIPDSVLKYMECWIEECKFEPKNGIESTFHLSGALPDEDGGIFLLMAYDMELIQVRGSTGAMNSNREMTKYMLVPYVNKDKEIKWTAGIREMSENGMFMTRRGRSCFFVKDHSLGSVLIGGKGLVTVQFDKSTGAKSYSSIFQLPMKKIKYPNVEFDTVDKTILPIGNGEYIVTVTFENELSIIKFKPNK